MDLSLRLLRYVVAAADHGHVTEAARRLNVSQPSVSAAIAELESAVGLQIFVRHHARGVTLTPAGERLVNDARLLLKHAADFTKSAEQLGTALSGEITIGCFQTLAVRFMPALLAKFAQLHPGILVMLYEGDQEELLAMLLAGRAELALAYGFALPGEVEAEGLSKLPPYLMMPKTHRLARRENIELGELAADPFVLLDLPHSRDYFYSLFRSAGFTPQIVFRSRSHELIRGLVAHGHGCAIHNAIPATEMTYDGHAVELVALAGDLPPAEVSLLRLKRCIARPAVEAFAGFLRAEFGPDGLFAPGTVVPPRQISSA